MITLLLGVLNLYLKEFDLWLIKQACMMPVLCVLCLFSNPSNVFSAFGIDFDNVSVFNE
ncbi:hypothetical protein MNSC_07070 [Minisyncoccus archaeophilus]